MVAGPGQGLLRAQGCPAGSQCSSSGDLTSLLDLLHIWFPSDSKPVLNYFHILSKRAEVFTQPPIAPARLRKWKHISEKGGAASGRRPLLESSCRCMCPRLWCVPPWADRGWGEGPETSATLQGAAMTAPSLLPLHSKAKTYFQEGSTLSHLRGQKPYES